MPVDARRTPKVLLPSLLLAVQSVGVASSGVPRPAPQASAQANPDLLTRRWDAKWISVAGSDAFAFGVYHFRKTIDLAFVRELQSGTRAVLQLFAAY
jgi:hypothetical protein